MGIGHLRSLNNWSGCCTAPSPRLLTAAPMAEKTWMREEYFMADPGGGPVQGPAEERELRARGRGAFPGFELRWLVRTPSTQDVVLAAARAGAAEGFCCLAEEQTAGRGRLGRSWVAPGGTALLCSILLRPRRGPAPVPLAAGLAVVDALAAACGVEARLKWPNDVLAGGGKLAGILAEGEPAAPGSAPAVVVGVGLNLRIDEFPTGVLGASLHHLVAPSEPPSAPSLLGDLLVALAARMAQADAGGTAAIAADWRRRAIGLGQPVCAITPAGEVTGTAVDIDDDGALLVDTHTAGVMRLLAGDVHLVAEPTERAP
jgi:BirA family transcriptional regulator, biotin operon repressor / biotin---[acetyl-CoA-carboxylase] ligase